MNVLCIVGYDNIATNQHNLHLMTCQVWVSNYRKAGLYDPA